MLNVNPTDPRRARLSMHNGNALKIGVFGANCSSARTATLVPERWLATWPDCLKLARHCRRCRYRLHAADRPLEGLRRRSDFHGSTLETVTWACGLLGATKRITVFGTVHAPLFHPLIAAKEMVTADHIGAGRFGLNIVAGWNEGEFEMFGVEQRAPRRALRVRPGVDRRGQARLVRSEEFDFDGRYFKLKGVRAKPKPYGGTRPLIMNAGSFRRRPGVRDAQLRRVLHLDRRRAARRRRHRAAVAEEKLIEATAQKVATIKAEGEQLGRAIEVYTQGQVICRPTQKEAEDYHHYANVENADWPAVERMLELRGVTPQNTPPAEYAAKRMQQAVERHRRQSVCRIARPGCRAVRQSRPCRRARHRGVVRELPQRRAVFLRRGAAAAGANGVARELTSDRLPSPPRTRGPRLRPKNQAPASAGANGVWISPEKKVAGGYRACRIAAACRFFFRAAKCSRRALARRAASSRALRTADLVAERAASVGAVTAGGPIDRF